MYDTTNQLEDALALSIDDMRVAAHMLRIHGADKVAKVLSDRADKNMALLLPWVRP